MCLPYSEEQCVKGTLLEPQHPRMPFRKLCETYGIKKRYLKQKTRNNSGVVIVVLCERWNWPGVRKLPLRTDGTWISLYCYCAQNLTKTDRRDARASCLAYGGWLGADVLSHRPLHGSERGVGAACSAPLDNTVECSARRLTQPAPHLRMQTPRVYFRFHSKFRKRIRVLQAGFNVL